MSTRAIRAEIALKGLDPHKRLKCDKNGRLVEAGKAEEPVAAPKVEEKPVLRNALVQFEEPKKPTEEPMQVEVAPEPAPEVVSEPVAEEAPKKIGKKKKAVSTDL